MKVHIGALVRVETPVLPAMTLATPTPPTGPLPIWSGEKPLPPLPSALTAPKLTTGLTRQPTPRLDGPARIEKTLRGMTTADKVSLLIMGYGDVHTPPATGAIIVNQTHLNASGTAQLHAAVTSASLRTGVAEIVAADQEGGGVNRLVALPGLANHRFLSPKQMQSLDTGAITAEGKRVGAALALAQVNMTLAPSLDVADPGTLMANMNRSFGSTVEDVTTRAGAFIAGMRETNPGLMIVAKHFPGYDVRSNSDISISTDHASAADIRTRSRAFFGAGDVDGYMLNSIHYEAFGGESACFSKEVVAMIRAERPDAVIITDDLGAPGLFSHEVCAYKNYEAMMDAPDVNRVQLAGLLRTYPQLGTSAGRAKLRAQVDTELRVNTVKAFTAGVDLFLIMDNRAVLQVRRALLDMLAAQPELVPQLDAAVTRVLAMVAKRTAP